MARMLAADAEIIPGMAGDFTGWHRAGRGRSFQFYALDDEVAEWLVETLPCAFAPYVVFREQWAHRGLAVHELSLDDIAQSLAEDREARHWIKSAVLTPALQADDISVPGDLGKLSFNGLISVRVGADRNGRREDADLGLIDRIRHSETGEERRQPEYLRIFERLRRAMRKRLVVQTEDRPMTADAAAAHARGQVTFAASPRQRDGMSRF
jgi:hypothetical protein